MLKSAKKTVKPFVAMAEMVQKFVSETPKRFHSRPADQDHFEPIKMAMPLKNTIPQSPMLETATRMRPVYLPEQEVFPPFKAAPIDVKVFESQGDYGVPRVEKKQPTVPVEFHLHSESRSMNHTVCNVNQH